MLGNGLSYPWAPAGRGWPLPSGPPAPTSSSSASPVCAGSCGAKTAVHQPPLRARGPQEMPALPSCLDPMPALPCLLLPPPSPRRPEARRLWLCWPAERAVLSGCFNWGSQLFLGCREEGGGGGGPGLRCSLAGLGVAPKLEGQAQ